MNIKMGDFMFYLVLLFTMFCSLNFNAFGMNLDFTDFDAEEQFLKDVSRCLKQHCVR